MLEQTTADAIALENTPRRAHAIGALLTLALRTFEVGELEQRMAALEARLVEEGARLRLA